MQRTVKSSHLAKIKRARLTLQTGMGTSIIWGGGAQPLPRTRITWKAGYIPDCWAPAARLPGRVWASGRSLSHQLPGDAAGPGPAGTWATPGRRGALGFWFQKTHIVVQQLLLSAGSVQSTGVLGTRTATIPPPNGCLAPQGKLRLRGWSSEVAERFWKTRFRTPALRRRQASRPLPSSRHAS